MPRNELEQLRAFQKRRADALALVRTMVPRCTVPPGNRGEWHIDTFSIADTGITMEAARALWKGQRGYTPPGQYTRLWHNDRGVVMSDTLEECEDLLPLVKTVKGRVLVTGLGLGIAVDALLRNPEVLFVTVIEKHKRIIQLVAPHLYELHGDESLQIIRADAFTWEPPKAQTWDYAWHDIWDTVNGDNVPEMALLRARYRKRVKVKQLCWTEREARREQ